MTKNLQNMSKELEFNLLETEQTLSDMVKESQLLKIVTEGFMKQLGEKDQKIAELEGAIKSLRKLLRKIRNEKSSKSWKITYR